MKIIASFGVAFAIILIILTSCVAANSGKINYRIDVEAEADGYKGHRSSIWQTTAGKSVFGGEYPMYNRRGEAVVVEFPNRPPLLMLTASRDSDGEVGHAELHSMPYIVFDLRHDRSYPFGNDMGITAARYIQSHYQNAPMPVTCSAVTHSVCPFFVSFRDASDPASVFEVPQVSDGSSPIRILGVTLTVTTESPTKKIAKVLPWLTDKKSTPLVPRLTVPRVAEFPSHTEPLPPMTSQQGLPARLWHGDFTGGL